MKENEVSLEEKMNDLRRMRDEKQNERRGLFKKDTDLEEAIKTIKEQQKQWDKQLQKSMPVGLKSALEMIKKLTQEHHLEGVFGTVGELINCKEQYFTAIDVAARNHLFSLVVEHSSIAEQLIQHLIQDRLGRVTFIPLDQLQDTGQNQLEEGLMQRAVPLMKVLQTDQKFLPALEHVFGKTVLVADLDSASEISKRGVNCVNIEGDELRKNGSMKGGYYEKSKSKMKAIKESMQSAQELEKREQERLKTGEALAEIGQQISNSVNQIDQLNLDSRTQKTRLNEVIGSLKNPVLQNCCFEVRNEIRSCKQQFQVIQEDLNQLDRNTESSDLIEKNLNQQIESLRSEQGTPLNSKLSRTEKAEIKTLQIEIKVIKKINKKQNFLFFV